MLFYNVDSLTLLFCISLSHINSFPLLSQIQLSFTSQLFSFLTCFSRSHCYYCHVLLASVVGIATDSIISFSLYTVSSTYSMTRHKELALICCDSTALSFILTQNHHGIHGAEARTGTTPLQPHPQPILTSPTVGGAIPSASACAYPHCCPCVMARRRKGRGLCASSGAWVGQTQAQCIPRRWPNSIQEESKELVANQPDELFARIGVSGVCFSCA
jgi:hypothetical protein